MKKYIIGTAILLCFPFVMNAQSYSTPCLDLQANIGYGARGSNVIALQNKLSASGYFNEEITGYFGPITYRAVKAYQVAHGIDNTGYVGVLTRASIKSETCSTSNTSYQTSPVQQAQTAPSTQCPVGYICTPNVATYNTSSAYVPGSYYSTLSSQYSGTTQTGVTTNTAASSVGTSYVTSGTDTVTDSITAASGVSTDTTVGNITSVTTSETDASCPALSVCVY